jgi:hypothetical protein
MIALMRKSRTATNVVRCLLNNSFRGFTASYKKAIVPEGCLKRQGSGTSVLIKGAENGVDYCR